LEDITGKISAISAAAGIPIYGFVATAKDIFRKPNTAMWTEMVKRSSAEIDMENSFFVGDAAGRPARGEKKKVSTR
jgi:bifunctional polynucleotide phosphatase/kinase